MQTAQHGPGKPVIAVNELKSQVAPSIQDPYYLYSSGRGRFFYTQITQLGEIIC